MLDIEATNLAADFGRVLCACVKPLDGKTLTISQTNSKSFKDRPWDDSEVVKRTMEELSKYDVWVTYYGKGFDIPFLKTRALSIGDRPYLYAFHIDLYFWVKYGLRMSRRSLLRMQEYLNLTEKKTPLTPEIWQKATAGNREAYNSIIEHCQQDVIVLEDVYKAALPHIKTLSRAVV